MTVFSIIYDTSKHLFLILGFFTRISALISMGLSIVLMLMFGWQGATCIDEWTMAACNLAMGTTILLCGAGFFALDNVLLRKKPHLVHSKLFAWCSGALFMPLNKAQYKKLALALLCFVVVFDVGTYHHYRGSVVTPFHSGPVSPTVHSLELTDGQLTKEGVVKVHAYVNAGTPEAPERILDAWLVDNEGNILVHWDTKALSKMPKESFVNDYAYGQFKTGPYGFQAPVGSASTIIFPAVDDVQLPANVTLMLTDIAGHTFKSTLKHD